MSEEKPVEGAKPKEKKKSAAPAATSKRVKKAEWSLERCQRAAHRFGNVTEWQAGAPSSYKAADAKGWIAQCTSHMKGLRKAS